MVEQRDETQHDQKPHHPLLEMGLFLVVVASPLAWTPLTSAAFVDLKLVTVLVGALLMAIGTRRVDATVCLAAGLWFGAVTVASALGVDPGWSLLGEERQSAGLVMYLACAVLICVGGSIPASLRARIPLWLVVTGMLVAGLQILQTFVDIGASNWTLGRSGSTLGHPVAVGAFMAVAVTCCASVLRPRLYVPLLVVLASALSLTANRGGWIGLVLGVAVSFRMSRTGLGRVAAT
ncbi:MAG TPA: hypothetical protein VNE62_11155, partial [Actinomycetota bacterium]|nr:hypothetical protein [Actinomycetota bacterium]